MVLTRVEAKEAFNHVLDNVLGRGDGTPLKSALLANGCDDIGALATILPADLDTLTYQDIAKPGSYLPVSKGDKSIVRLFKDYVIHCHNSGNPIKDWTTITQEDLDHFRINVPYYGPLSATTPGLDILEHYGKVLTRMALAEEDTQKITLRSHPHPFSAGDPNLCADLLGGEDNNALTLDTIIEVHHGSEGNGEPNPVTTEGSTATESDGTPVPDTEDDCGCTFVEEPTPPTEEDGTHHVTIPDGSEGVVGDIFVEDHDIPTTFKSLCPTTNNRAAELFTYKHTVPCQVPVSSDHQDFKKASTDTVKIEWENGEITANRHHHVAAKDLVTLPLPCANSKNLILMYPGWYHF